MFKGNATLFVEKYQKLFIYINKYSEMQSTELNVRDVYGITNDGISKLILPVSPLHISSFLFNKWWCLK